MELQITGVLNYTPTRLEEAWIAAGEEYGFVAAGPEPVNMLCLEEPIISRRAAQMHAHLAGMESMETIYTRGLRDTENLVYTRADGSGDLLLLETIVKYINDFSQISEEVNFHNWRSDLTLYFEKGELGGIQNWYRRLMLPLL